jgi:DNA-directed RNA polymerase subunit RPC12/RpoP
LPSDSNSTAFFYARSPYAEAFDIGYPQENLEGEMYKYRCRHCKRLTTDINGKLENHAEACAYRIARAAELPAKSRP